MRFKNLIGIIALGFFPIWNSEVSEEHSARHCRQAVYEDVSAIRKSGQEDSYWSKSATQDLLSIEDAHIRFET